MKNLVYRFLVFFVSFSVALYFLMKYADNEVFQQYDFYFSSWSIICFLFISTTLIYITVGYIHKVLPDKSGFAFLSFGMLKMFAAVIFLIPLIQAEMENKIPATLFFFIPYFIVLFIETLLVVRLINKK